MIEPAEINKIHQESDCLYNAEAINTALDQMAEKITADLHDKNLLVLCVVTGGIIPAGHLVTRFNFPMQLDYVHATRYQGETSGGKLNWLKEPALPLDGRNILIIDDIFDEGITISEIARYCFDKGACGVYTAVLIDKIHDRKADFKVDYIGLSVEDRYLYGFGMDYKNYLRNINAIHAVKGM